MSISFACPHCGRRTEVDEEHAGQSGPCAGCGETITVPAATAPGGDAGAQAAEPPRKSSSSTPIVVAVVCLCGVLLCGGIVACGLFMAGSLIPAVEASREAARQVQCKNNLMQIGSALHQYQTSHRRFPASTGMIEGNPCSWRVLILPYLGERELYDRYNFDEPWDSPANQALADEMPVVFACPSSDDASKKRTSYVMVVGKGMAKPGPYGPNMHDLRDGIAYTIIVVEATGCDFNWLEPVDLNADEISFLINDGSGRGIGSDHPGVANVLFYDGSVRSLNDWIAAEDMKALLTTSGNELVDLDTL